MVKETGRGKGREEAVKMGRDIEACEEGPETKRRRDTAAQLFLGQTNGGTVRSSENIKKAGGILQGKSAICK